jgi:hypothetical protein
MIKFLPFVGIILFVVLMCPQYSYSNVDCCMQEEVCIWTEFPNDPADLSCCSISNFCSWNRSLWCADYYMSSVSSCPPKYAPCAGGSAAVIIQNVYGYPVTRTAWRYARLGGTCDSNPPLGCGPEYQWYSNGNNNCTTSLCNNDICPCS